MKTRMKPWLVMLAVAAVLLLGGGPLTQPALAQVQYPVHVEGHAIIDDAGLISDPDAAHIEVVAQKLAADKNIRLDVVTIVSMGADGVYDWPIERFARGLHASLTAANPSEAPMGMLLLVSKGDHKARIHLGSAWKTRSDDTCEAIMDHLIIPRFKQKDFSGGIVAGVDALDRLARGESEPAATAAPTAPASPANTPAKNATGGNINVPATARPSAPAVTSAPIPSTTASTPLTQAEFENMPPEVRQMINQVAPGAFVQPSSFASSPSIFQRVGHTATGMFSMILPILFIGGFIVIAIVLSIARSAGGYGGGYAGGYRGYGGWGGWGMPWGGYGGWGGPGWGGGWGGWGGGWGGPGWGGGGFNSGPSNSGSSFHSSGSDSSSSMGSFSSGSSGGGGWSGGGGGGGGGGSVGGGGGATGSW